MVWNVDDGSVIMRVFIQRGPLNNVKVSPDGGLIVCTGKHEGFSYLVNADSGKINTRIKHSGIPMCCDISLDNNIVLVGTGTLSKLASRNNEGRLSVWNAKSGEMVAEYSWDRRGIYSALFDETGNWCVIVGSKGAEVKRVDKWVMR